jgi:hypothetical protein
LLVERVPLPLLFAKVTLMRSRLELTVQNRSSNHYF